MAIDPKTGLETTPTPQIDATKIGTTASPTVPSPITVPISTYTSPIATNTATIQAQLDSQTAEREAQNRLAEAENKNTDIANLNEQLGGKTAAQAELYNRSGGVNDYYNQLQDINAKMVGLNNEALSIPLQEQNAAIGTGRVQGQVDAMSSQRLRDNALKALSLTQQAALVEGNYNKAKNIADQQINIKYAQIEADIKSKQAQLDFLTNFKLTPAQEKAKEARQNALKKEEQDIAEKKKNEAEISTMITQAIPNAPASVIANARKLAESGASKLAVAQSLGVYGGDYLKMEAYRSQLETDKAQRANIYSQIAERNAEAIKKNNLANFVAPPIVNAQTGAVDPKSAIASVIKSTGGKLKGGQAALDVLSSVQSLAARNTKGTFEGVGFGSGLTPERFKSQSEISNRQDIEAIGLKVQQWASGASLTEEQTKMVNKFTPQLGDSDNAVKSKINGLVNFMMGQVSSDLAGQGINYDPGVIDMFSGIQSVDNKTFLGSIPSAPTDTTKLFDNKTFFDR